MPENRIPHKIPSSTCLEIYATEANLAAGPAPAFFYFALTGNESLSQDPYNQPIHYLEGSPIRSFSFDLPFHGEKLSPSEAIEQWEEELLAERDFIEPYLAAAQQNIAYLIDEGFIDPARIAVGGLSRGAFIAAHLAAREPRIKTLLGFAPLTQVGWDREWRRRHAEAALAKKYDLHHIAAQLVGRKVRFYIGNRDNRVGTSVCYKFIEKLAETSYQQGFRSPPVDLIITSSIGHKGHGTSPSTFRDGADWLRGSICP